MQIRPAIPTDTAALHSLVCELADFERLRDTVTATEDDLRRHLFGPNPCVEALIAIEEDQAVGFALFFATYSTFVGKSGLYLEDLYVQTAHRGKGVGRELLTRLAQIAVERDCGRLEWSTLNWNEPAIYFYESLGAKPLADWTLSRLTGDALSTLGKP